MTYRFRNTTIPEHIFGGIRRWIEFGDHPGHFLMAVITNNLKEAVGRADDECIAGLPAIVGYLYNVAPSECWGSEERAAAWALARKD